MSNLFNFSVKKMEVFCLFGKQKSNQFGIMSHKLWLNINFRSFENKIISEIFMSRKPKKCARFWRAHTDQTIFAAL